MTLQIAATVIMISIDTTGAAMLIALYPARLHHQETQLVLCTDVVLSNIGFSLVAVRDGYGVATKLAGAGSQ